MKIAERREYVESLLDSFYTRSEAAEKLAETEGISLQTAKNFVYTMFSGPQYDDRQILKRAREAAIEQQS